MRFLLPAMWLVLVLASTPGLARASGVGAAPYAVPAAWLRNRALMARFDTLEARGHAEMAWAFLDSLVGAARERGDRALLVQALVRRGGTRAYRGDLPAGEPDLLEAERLGEQIRDTLGVLSALRWHAYALAAQGNLAAARPLDERMRALARAWGSPSHEGWAEVGLAYIDLREGRMTGAVARYRRSVRLMRLAGDRVGLHQAGIGLARVLDSEGRYREELATYRGLLADARATGDLATEREVLNDVGSCEYVIGDPAAAMDDWRRSRDMDLEQGLTLSAESGPQANMALALLRLRHFDEAAALLDTLAADAAAKRNPEAWFTAREELATCRSAQGRLDEAERILGEALARPDSVPAVQRASLRAGLAKTLVADGRNDEAFAQTTVLLADPAVHSNAVLLRGTLSVRAAALLALGRPREALAAARLAPLEPGSATTEDAQLALARSRAFRALALPDSALAEMRRVDAFDEEAHARARSLEWHEELSIRDADTSVEYALAMLEAPSLGPPAARARAAFDMLQTRTARTLLERVRSPEHATGHPEPAAVTLATLQHGVLRRGEVLLDWHQGEAGTLLFAITPRAFRLVHLPPRAQLQARFARFFDVLAGDDAQAGEMAARAVSHVCLDSVADLVAAGSRIIVSGLDGALPLAVLPFGPRGAPLVAGREVAYSPSASLLATLRARPVRASHGVYALAGGRDASGRPLPGAESETRWLAATFADVTLRAPDPERRASRALAELSGYEVLHFAGHSESDESNPWASGFLVGREGGRDAWLRAAEISRLRLPARLCVLSGCRSAGVGEPGEGVIGLSTAFLAAGVASTVATLWPVDDAATSAFMRVFYRSLAVGRTVAAALADAQNALRVRPATSAPAAWAAFVLVGEPGTRVTLRPAGSSPAMAGGPREFPGARP